MNTSNTNEQSKKIKKPTPNFFAQYGWIFLCVFIAWVSCWWLVTMFIKGSTENTAWVQRGQFGDLFGSVNALFSGLAFAGIIITIFLQKEELALQRKELRDTRKVFKTQTITMKRQRFESTFFSMLSLHFGFIQSLKYNDNIRGADTLSELTENFKIAVRDITEYKDHHYLTYMNRYSTFHSLLYPMTSQYLQSLIALHRIIQQYSTDEKIRTRYYGILKSYISLPERKFLFYHVLFAENSGVNNSIRQIENDLKIIEVVPLNNLLHHSHRQFLTNPNRPAVV
jgi:hypothetical protein